MESSNPQMRAWRVQTLGDYHALTLETQPTPRPLPGEALVAIRAFAPGFPDMLMIQGLYQLKPTLPFTPCSEFCGVVSAVGEGVLQFTPGDSVMGMARFGAAAQFITWRASELLPLPAAFDFAHGAAYLVAYKTAYVALVVRGALQAGDTLLVHGAAGGVGLAAVDLGLHLGARVIATASGAEKMAVVRAKGAHHVLDARGAGFREAVKALTGGRGADVIYDPVGGDVFDESLRCIAPFGRMLVIGFASGRIPTASMNYALIKQISLIGVRAGEYGRLDPAGGARVNAALLAAAQAGQLTPHVHARFSFTQLPQAFDEIAGRRVIGRVVVETDN